MQDREHQWAADMRAAQAGSGDAYVRLLNDISASFRQFAGHDLRRYGLQLSDSEDVLQEILLAVHVKRHTWRQDHPFIPWLRAITRHKLIDFVRRRGRRGEVPIEDFADIFAAPEAEPEHPVSITQFIADLPERQRHVVQELALGGASVAETASKLKMSRNAVYVAYHRAVMALSARLAGERP